MWVGATAADHLRRRHRWSVHSVFDASANLCLEADARDAAPTLLHVGCSDVRSPFGIDLPEPVWRAWRRYLRASPRGGAVRGNWDPVRGRFSGGAPLSIGPRWADAVGDSTVAVSPSPSLVPGHPSPSAAILTSGILAGSDPTTMLAAVRAAFEGLLAGRADAVTRLLGRGPGLTPSGDDVLIGMLGVLHRAGLPGRSADAVAALHRLLETSQLTTDVSIAYLRDACRGRLAGPLRRVLRATDADDAATFLATLRAVGHTSGADTILGLAVAVEGLRGLSLPSSHTSSAHTTRSHPCAA